ncbi:uncharacterized protein B0H64DRAFT_225523 [Chaetomium fimeti]|uniref:Uncharacterized protein n=1 Tax=Chaetomium fimeti TaxID=1854472 RepID=A0AAE0LNT1_9PEZI|nr:hypothetical protein B0H64DRAFT_225523 [Chaetomium fimeti]
MAFISFLQLRFAQHLRLEAGFLCTSGGCIIYLIPPLDAAHLCPTHNSVLLGSFTGAVWKLPSPHQGDNWRPRSSKTTVSVRLTLRKIDTLLGPQHLGMYLGCWALRAPATQRRPLTERSTPRFPRGSCGEGSSWKYIPQLPLTRKSLRAAILLASHFLLFIERISLAAKTW